MFLFLISVCFFHAAALSQTSCLNEKALTSLDANWEKAQLDANADFLEDLLAENFIWIHNHASLTDDKSAVVNRAKRQKESGANNTRSRNSQEVKVIVLGSTAIVTGNTIVDRGPSPVTYNFMRTYVEINKKCYLLANHTMAVPEEE